MGSGLACRSWRDLWPKCLSETAEQQRADFARVTRTRVGGGSGGSRAGALHTWGMEQPPAEKGTWELWGVAGSLGGLPALRAPVGGDVGSTQVRRGAGSECRCESGCLSHEGGFGVLTERDGSGRVPWVCSQRRLLLCYSLREIPPQVTSSGSPTGLRLGLGQGRGSF